MIINIVGHSDDDERSEGAVNASIQELERIELIRFAECLKQKESQQLESL